MQYNNGYIHEVLYENNMAEGSNSGNENPFSFKTFVKSKQETKSTTSKIKQDKQKSKSSPVSLRKRDSSKDERPFPEVNRQGKLQNFILFSVNPRVSNR